MNACQLVTGTRADADERPAPSFDLIPGLGAKEIDRELRLADRQSDVGTRRLAFYLADMEKRGICQLLGYATATVYAVQRLEMGRRHAQQLIAAGRALEELPKIDAAFCEGRINWTRVRLLTKIAVAETESAWLERAVVLRLGDFEREVLTSEKGRPPRSGRKGLPQVKIGVAAKLDRLAYEAWELAKRKLADESGEPVTDADLMASAARLVLSTARDGTVPGRTRLNDSIYRIVVDRCSECQTAYLQTAEGPAELRKPTAEAIACEAKVEVIRDEEAGERTATPVDPVRAEAEELADPTPPWMRTKVLIRDGYTCCVCRRSLDVQAHHVIWRSMLGRTKPSNLATLCSRCHGLVHESLLHVAGTAPHRLEITDRDGNALGRNPEAIGCALRNVRALTPIEEGVKEDPGEAAGSPWPSEVTFGTLPRTGDAKWFARHAHLFRWNDVRGEMVFEPGLPVEPRVDAEAGEATQPACGGRPRKLADVVGQQRVVDVLGVAVEAAKVRERPLHHTLLLGEAGLGKTTLAKAVGAEMGARVSVTTGPLIKDASVLIKALAALSPNEILFIDEIHGLPRQVAESLYESLEDGVLTLPVTDGHFTRTLELRLNPFTLIGATTELSRVPTPLQSRFTIREHLDAYAESDVAEMVRREMTRDALGIDPAAAQAIARMARGIPRDGVKLAQRVADFAVARRVATIDRPFVDAAMRRFGIDERGLGTVERKALGALERHGKGRPMGLSRWAASSGLCVTVLRQMCEPVLIRHGLIAVTHRGRMAI